MAHLVERSLLIPEVRVSTPVIGKIYIEHLFVYLFIIICFEKTKINKKRPGMAHLKKNVFFVPTDLTELELRTGDVYLKILTVLKGTVHFETYQPSL